MKIRLKNFQSVSDSEIEIKGLTVITGQNNAGKSALVRALSGVFSNDLGNSYVRYGQDKFTVDVTFDDGHHVVWEKGPKIKPTYIVDGYTIHPGKGVPDEVVALGVRPIMVGANAVWPQLAPQFSGQLFLVDQPGSIVAEAVADVEKVSNLTQALRLAESDKRNNVSLLKTRRQDKEDLTTEVKRYSEVDTISQHLSDIEQMLEESKRLSQSIRDAIRLRDQLKQCRDHLKMLSAVKDLPTVDESNVILCRSIQEEIKAHTNLSRRLVDSRSTLARLSPTKMIPVYSPSGDMRVVDDLKEALLLRSKITRLKNSVVMLESALSSVCIQDDAALDAKVDKVRKIQKGIENLRDIKTRRIQATNDSADARSRLDTNRISMQATQQEISSLMGELGKCPACGTTSGGIHGS